MMSLLFLRWLVKKFSLVAGVMRREPVGLESVVVFDNENDALAFNGAVVNGCCDEVVEGVVEMMVEGGINGWS